MRKNVSFLLMTAALLAGCSWRPWSTSPDTTGTGPRTPPGATAYACEGKKRLLVRFEADGKSAWVIYPDREFRLQRAAAASGDRFSNGRSTLTVADGEATLAEGGTLEFAKCKPEGKSEGK